MFGHQSKFRKRICSVQVQGKELFHIRGPIQTFNKKRINSLVKEKAKSIQKKELIHSTKAKALVVNSIQSDQKKQDRQRPVSRLL